MNEQRWKRLLDKIHEGNVVPILGSRLLVSANGQTSFQTEVAQRLLSNHGMEGEGGDLSLFREVSEVVAKLKQTVPLPDLYDEVSEAIYGVTQDAGFAVPPPIVQLAQIADFRLFVTLTPDDLLARTLKTRCAVNEVIHSPNLPTSEVKDLARDWKERQGEVNLLYTFGKASMAPTFAIHDEDVLEYAHNLIADGRKILSVFLGELQQRSLLLIGCNFPEWLSRFFLRATSQKRLSEHARRSWLIEQLRPEESFTCFLSSYSTNTEVLSDLPPAEFVAELHRRWMHEQGAAEQQPLHPANESPSPKAMFFISYSRQTDRARAETLYQALRSLGVAEGEIWFDRNSIEPGQDFQRRIIDGINGCRYMLPLLSQSADSRQEAFVFTEWGRAEQRRERMNREFILPIIVDGDFKPDLYSFESVRIWRDEKHLDFAHAPDGVPDKRLESKLRMLVRDARKDILPS